jgi:hypothetical protein
MLWSRCAAARPAQRAQPLDDSPEAAHTAAVVNEASDCIRRVLEAHPANAERVAQGKPPANVVLLRGCGCRLALQEFRERHGLRACMVAPTKIIAGLGMSLGIQVLHVPGTTGDYRTLFHRRGGGGAVGGRGAARWRATLGGTAGRHRSGRPAQRAMGPAQFFGSSHGVLSLMLLRDVPMPRVQEG